MDELTQYLKSNCYYDNILEIILNKKITITKEHISNINIDCCNVNGINIINLFEKYGYVFTNDDYIMLLKKNRFVIYFIPKDKQTNEICKIAVQQDGYILHHISEDNKTNEICEIAVQKFGFALKYVPEDKKTIALCKIAVEKDIYALDFVPDDKKHLFVKN